jgi:hypothetical protein
VFLPQVSKDKLSARYTGNAAHNNDVGSIQANRPVPRQSLVYYYEVLIKDRGDRACIGIGYADQDFKLGRQPGWVRVLGFAGTPKAQAAAAAAALALASSWHHLE